MRIPKSFTLFGNTITVREIEKCDDDLYGYWDDIKEEIVIGHKMKTKDGLVNLKQEQIESTFWHEYFHAAQWYSGREYSECEAQTYANMIMELIRSSDLKINPSIIQEPITPV